MAKRSRKGDYTVRHDKADSTCQRCQRYGRACKGRWDPRSEDITLDDIQDSPRNKAVEEALETNYSTKVATSSNACSVLNSANIIPEQ